MTIPKKIAANTGAFRTLAAVGGISWAMKLKEKELREPGSPGNSIVSSMNVGHDVLKCQKSRFDREWSSKMFNLFEPSRTLLESSPHKRERKSKDIDGLNSKKRNLEYDFVIIGNGNAGQSALRTLKEKCPSAKIAVVDPMRSAASASKGKVEYFADTVTGMDPREKSITLLSDSSTRLRYSHGVLVATGARGAPPPLDLFDPSSLSRVLELRTTELKGNDKRPVLSPDIVRRALIDTAAKGARVGILGSGWEAIDLAIAAAEVSKRQPTMVFGNPGPVWSTLPQYLSSELRKKMKRKGIDIQDRSIVRYIADVPRAQGTSRQLELHTARTYDILETQRVRMDLLACAPDAFGVRGTASLPTTETPERMKESSDGRPWYKTCKF